MGNEKWTPETLTEQLKQSVIGQDRYLKDLCTSVWMHSLSKTAEERLGHSIDNLKLNMLVLGKSGTGKTLAIQSLAKLLDLNLVIEDASVFTGAGWKGRETSSIIKDILTSAEATAQNAEYSIVVLDEIDKVFADSAKRGSFSAWNNLLKLIEGTDMEHTEGTSTYQMNTRNVLFICLGAFDGLEEIIKNRMQAGNSIGFRNQTTDIPSCDLFQYAKKEDLISYGVNPQFLGRMPIITATNELTEDDYVRILTRSKNSPIHRLHTVLRTTMGVQISISQNAARHLAQKAIREQTGARALLSEVTEVFKDGLYQIAGRSEVKELRLSYSSTEGLKLQYVKGARKKLPPSYKQMTEFFVQDWWKTIPLELASYGCNLSGISRYVEDLLETVELHSHRLSRRYTYRQLKASVHLITSAILYILTMDTPQNLYEIGGGIDLLISHPPTCDSRTPGMDACARSYWRSLEYEDNVEDSRDLAILILEEYCQQRFLDDLDTHQAAS